MFFDDILVYSKLADEHPLVNCLLTPKKKRKSVFSKPMIEYLGHIIDAIRVLANPAKIQAMVD